MDAVLLIRRSSPRVPPGRVGRREPEPGFLKKPQRLSLLKNAYFSEGELSERFPSGSLVFSEAVPSLDVWGPPGPVRSIPAWTHDWRPSSPGLRGGWGRPRALGADWRAQCLQAQRDAGAHLGRDESRDPGICCKNTSHSLSLGRAYWGNTHVSKM